jgi:hypothetical protein
MTATIAPFDRPKPIAPAHLRAELAAIDAADRALTLALAGRGVARFEVAALAVRDALLRPRTEAEQIAEARYDREVDEYNAAVRDYNAAIAAAAQARVNALQVAKVRAAACPRCFATHAGEC